MDNCACHDCRFCTFVVCLRPSQHAAKSTAPAVLPGCCFIHLSPAGLFRLDPPPRTHVNLIGSLTHTHLDVSAALEAGRRTAKKTKSFTLLHLLPSFHPAQQCVSVPVTTHQMQSHAQSYALLHTSVALPFMVIIYP